MGKWTSATVALSIAALVGHVEARGFRQPVVTEQAAGAGRAVSAASTHAVRLEEPAAGFDRLAQFRREIEARRRQRKMELDAVRKLNKTEREEWLNRWEEQRRQAREQSVEREHRQQRELSERSPALAAFRERHAAELERRRQAYEEERQARWRALDRLSY